VRTLYRVNSVLYSRWDSVVLQRQCFILMTTYFMIFEVITVVKMSMLVFRFVTSCGLADWYQRFEETQCTSSGQK
jgi:uncharacterized membrane protein